MSEIPFFSNKFFSEYFCFESLIRNDHESNFSGGEINHEWYYFANFVFK